ncbi:ABC transporter ATP-binding protein [Pseudonocardia acaciae]|uniref:ABC transporter ATP-binding protein n=1 Tax=Pseudonocardia acaciae TaxID=551276 RepID=UPI0007E8C886|nr:ABC transporter ATP-binding protein [Pseudonocardia acaciae]
MNVPPVLRVRELSVSLTDGAPIVDGVSLDVAAGEVLGLVGESGSGKTTTALALLGYARPGARIRAEEISVAGERLDGRDEAALRAPRGRLISYVPQDPGGALNPSSRIGAALADVVCAHARDGEPPAEVVESALRAAELPTEPEFARRFPHQLSGGQQQRVCIAAALACRPRVLVLDEPTTGLDVLTQERILAQIEDLRARHRVAMVYVTHDLAVIAQVADRVAVMYGGRIIEQGPVASVLTRPRHPYTRGLITSTPDLTAPRRLQAMPGVAAGPGDAVSGCAFEPRCAARVDRCATAVPVLEPVGPGHDARCFRWRDLKPLELPALKAAPVANGRAGALLEVAGLRAEHRSRRERVVVAEDVSFAVDRGACVALVGESGSGKTTIARVIAGLHPPHGGSLRFADAPLAARARHRTLDQRRRIQIVFQNPADALNPRHDVRAIVARPIRQLRGLGRAGTDAEVGRLLDQVRLPRRIADRYPGELSGGERQRVGIARALAANPDLIVCDEITSALDVSVQAAILELLAELRAELGLSLLFITHDLGVVATIADQVLVLEHGRIRERGPTATVLDAPEHAYTQRLLAAAPSLHAAAHTTTTTPASIPDRLMDDSKFPFP